jgi:pyrimidine deaminase RibD-like protein
MACDYLYKNEAIKQCLKSSYKYRMGAVVIRKGNIVGKGCNIVHSNGIVAEGKHAEIGALINTKAKYRDGSTVYVCRLTKSDKIALARPCKACQIIMKKMGVKYAWYSTPNGWLRMTL